jgi:type II secretion system protein J
MPGTFYYDELSNSIIFNTSIKNLSLVTSNINRVQYMIEDNVLKRRQFFSSNPYNEEDNTETNLINNVEDIEFTFMHQMRWHDRWPLDEATANKFPELIRIDFSVGSSDYFWLIDPNIEYAYER